MDPVEENVQDKSEEDILNEGLEFEEPKETSEEEEPEEKEDEPEEKEEEEEEEEESEDDKSDDEEEEDPNAKIGGNFPDRPTYREVTKEFPTIFKKFPGLRTAFFREQKFSELFPTVEDASEAVEQLTVLKEGEQRLGSGDPKDFLEMLGGYNPNAQKKFINNFLPTLFHTNRTAFTVITQPILKNVLRTAMEQGKLHKNENLENSAYHLHEFIFGNQDLEAPLKKPEIENDALAQERADLERERRSLLESKQSEFTQYVLERGTKGIDRFIEQNLPADLTEFDKKAIKKEVVEQLAAVLRDDKAHLSTMDRLMRNASKAGFNSEFKERTTTAYLSRAKLALPAIIKKVKSEALKGKSKANNIPKRASASSSGVPKGNPSGAKDKDKASMLKAGKISELDFLND